MGFGDFDGICEQSPLPVCSILGPPSTLTTTHQPLLLTTCSARSIELANTIIFQAATDFAHIGALIMTTIMILHIRSKFTAVGRKEILTFFYIYLILTCISLVLDAGVIPATSGGAFSYFVAIQNGLTGALCMSLLVNGFVGFQLYEDGTALSVWLLRGTCLGMFIIEFFVSLMTFKGWGGLGPENTAVLFAVLYVVPALFIFVYVVMQVFLVLNTLQDRWPLGDLLFGATFFIAGQVLLYAVGTTICESTSHYLDSLFFATICNLLAVMMVYKYWDSITKEDLEFSVGTKQGNWEVVDPLLAGHDDSTDPYDVKRASFYADPAATSVDSMYDTYSLEYNPRPASRHHYLGNNSNPRLSGHGHAQIVDGRQGYGDVRKSANVVPQSRAASAQGPRGYDDYHDATSYQHDRQQSTVRGRSKGTPHARATSNEVVYDRY
ncbi:Chitin synthase, class 7 [Lithohypha guttulata]|nr:Chitin synthase, class 7 [Lithohypha guttulata]KAK5098278.1 Chitin synthase, class 7 [Lithohypha guttulata]